MCLRMHRVLRVDPHRLAHTVVPRLTLRNGLRHKHNEVRLDVSGDRHGSSCCVTAIRTLSECTMTEVSQQFRSGQMLTIRGSPEPQGPCEICHV